VALAAVALSAAGCGFGSGTKTVTVSRTQTVTTTQTITSKSETADPCTGAELAGNFALVPGSAGAGQLESAFECGDVWFHARTIHLVLPKVSWGC